MRFGFSGKWWIFSQLHNAMNDFENNPTQPTRPTDASGRACYDSLSGAFLAGCQDARERARQAAPKLKNVASEAACESAYILGFGAMFAGSLAREFIPHSVREGFARGASAGREAAKSSGESWKPEPGPHPV